MKNLLLKIIVGISFLYLFSQPASAQWVQTNGPYYVWDISSLAVSGSNIFAGIGSGVFLSTNNGTSWTAVNSGLPTNSSINCLAVSGSNIFAGTGSGVFLSTNNGTSWTAVNSGLTNTAVEDLDVSGSNIFAATSGGGVFLSTNNGTSWAAVNSGLSPYGLYVNSLAVNGSNIFAGTFGSGVFLSNNNGTSWTAAVNSGLTCDTVFCFAVSGSNIFAGTASGVFLSTNNGTSWTAVKSGLPTNSFIRSLAVSGTGEIFAGAGGAGVFLSTNNGTSWTAVNSGLSNGFVQALAVSSTGGIFAGTSGGGVLLSTNNGASWNPVNTGLMHSYASVISLAISGPNLFAATNKSGVFLSADAGANWTPVNMGLPITLVNSFAVSGPNLFAATGGGVFLSTNNGTSWSAVISGMTNTDVSSLVISASNLFAATGSGIFLSTNNGTSWNPANTGLPNRRINSLAVSGTNLLAGTNFAGTNVPTLFLSTNNGANWAPDSIKYTVGTYTSTVFTDINSFAVNGPNLFVATGSGVFLSTNNGTSWNPVNTGLAANISISSLAFSETGLFAGTGSGIWRRPLSEMIPVPVPAVPTLATPSNSAINQPLATSLTWNSVTGSSTYRVQLSTSFTFANTVVDDSTVASALKAIGPLSTSTTYYWRVNAKNSGGTSAWSDIWSFSTVPPAAGAPTLISPTNSATNQPLTTSLTWNAVTGASTYRIQLSTSFTFTNTVVDDSTVASALKAIGTLSTSTTYYWRINAKNAGGTSAWSDIWSFATVPPAAGAPTLVSPTNSATNQPLSMSLTWNPVAGAATYRVQLSTSASFASTVIDDSLLTSISQSVGPLSANSTYYWRVNTSNVGGISAWSAQWSFTTIPPVPNQVSLSSPANATVIVVDSVYLVWNKSPFSVDKYCLEMFTDSLMNGRFLIDSTITDTARIQKNIANNISYWWQVKAHNIAGWGISSGLNKFVVNIPVVAVLPAKYTCDLKGMSNSGSFIRYGLPTASNVSIKLYSIQGKLVQTICNTYKQAGYYQASMKSSNLSKGYYLLDFKAGNYSIRKRITNF
jgi:photosystem II stability/assembly factor-like uncharacterized protein/transposase-like protein